MNKKSSPKRSAPDLSEISAPNFLDIETRVFTKVGNDIYIGRFKADPALRKALQDEAQVFQKSRLWEILNASVTNEAYNLALLQSKDFDQVLSAKMLHHWGHFVRNVINILAKKD